MLQLRQSRYSFRTVKESPSIILQPILALTQNEYNEYRIQRMPDIAILGEFCSAIEGSPFEFLAQTGYNKYLISWIPDLARW